jgi:hypothetical protein
MDNPETLTTLGTQDTGQRLQKTKGAIKNGQSRNSDNIGYTRHRTKIRENQRGNQEWTIQKLWQHWVHKTQDKDYRKPKGQSRMDNPETVTTLGTQDTGQRLQKSKGAIKNGQSRNGDNIGYTRHRTKVTEKQRGNQEWTIQKLWQHWVHKTQDKD